MKELITLAVVAMSLAAGCGKKAGGGDVAARMEGLQKSMCECKDRACANKVNADMTKLGAEMAKNAKDDKPDPELTKKLSSIIDKYTECMTKIVMAGLGDPVKPTEVKPTEAEDPTPAIGSQVR